MIQTQALEQSKLPFLIERTNNYCRRCSELGNKVLNVTFHIDMSIYEGSSEQVYVAFIIYETN